jgi:hypothetical protein
LDERDGGERWRTGMEDRDGGQVSRTGMEERATGEGLEKVGCRHGCKRGLDNCNGVRARGEGWSRKLKQGWKTEVE